MDFWSRLIGGSGSPTKPPRANTPAERLASFKRACNALQQLWRKSTSLSSDEAATNYARNCLLRLNSILDDESRAPAPYPCLINAATSQFYIIVTKIALSSYDVEIIDAAARFFNIFIDGEAEGILDSRVFARALIDLVRRPTGPALAEYEEGNLIELLFAVANKIRLEPVILPAWFYPDRTGVTEKAEDGSLFAGTTRKNDFPLFYLLVEYVYHDGRIGDFARTGLLYLTETASKSRSLERWMIESDLATLMASGLGALYSRLSRKLPTTPTTNQLPLVLMLSDDRHLPSDPDHEMPDFDHNINAFLSYLMFWQDTLDHCTSVEVTDTLMDHFQVLFLEQLLYPSLLESSDVDGGSTASVITYLHRMLGVLDHPALVEKTLRYLLASQSPGRTKVSKVNPRMSLSRRKSLNVLVALAEAEDNPSPDLFNLVDLIIMSLQSKRSQTVAATLKLISMILRKHHIHVQSSLFKTSEPEAITHRNMVSLDRGMQRFFSMASAIANDGTVSQTYEELATDAVTFLENHSCAIHREPGCNHDVRVLMDSDPLFDACCRRMGRYFSNTVATNLALTEAFANLASCPNLALDGWFWPSAHGQQRKSTLTGILDDLLCQIQEWQSAIPEWDTLVASQKANFADETGDEPAYRSSISQLRNERVTTPPQSNRKSQDLSHQMMDSYAQSITPQSITPRGRKPLSVPSVERSSSGQMSMSPSPAPRTSIQQRNQYGSALRQTLLAPSTPSSTRTSSRGGSTTPDALRTRIILPTETTSAKLPAVERLRLGSDLDTSSSPSTPGTTTPSDQGRETPETSVSLGHVIINAIILQDFILEVAAIAQMRACLYGEITFDGVASMEH